MTLVVIVFYASTIAYSATFYALPSFVRWSSPPFFIVSSFFFIRVRPGHQAGVV